MKLSKTQFREWLENKNPRSFVGRPASACNCPIANFADQSAGLETVSVFPRNLHYFDKKNRTRIVHLPAWAQEFIETVDSNKTQSKVTAARALKILKKGV